MLIAGVSILVGLYNTIQGRRREIAILRAHRRDGRVTCSPAIVLESLFICLLGGRRRTRGSGNLVLAAVSPITLLETLRRRHPDGPDRLPSSYRSSPLLFVVGILAGAATRLARAPHAGRREPVPDRLMAARARSPADTPRLDLHGSRSCVLRLSSAAGARRSRARSTAHRLDARGRRAPRRSSCLGCVRGTVEIRRTRGHRSLCATRASGRRDDRSRQRPDGRPRRWPRTNRTRPTSTVVRRSICSEYDDGDGRHPGRDSRARRTSASIMVGFLKAVYADRRHPRPSCSSAATSRVASEPYPGPGGMLVEVTLARRPARRRP